MTYDVTYRIVTKSSFHGGENETGESERETEVTRTIGTKSKTECIQVSSFEKRFNKDSSV
jgi:hypothetical protein